MPRDARISIVDLLISRGIEETLSILKSLRSELIRTIGPLRGQSPAFTQEVARQILSQFEPELAQVLSDTTLSAWIVAMDEIAGDLPSELFAARLIEEPVDGKELLFEGRDSPIRLPKIEKAAENLQQRKILRRRDFDRLRADQREFAFTITGEDNLETLDKIRGLLEETVSEGPSLRKFNKKMEEAAFGGDSSLSPSRRELVYRANVQTAYKRGTDEIMADPIVAAEFPYVLDASIDDTRRSEVCDWFAKSGIDGTPVFRADDPLYRRFAPPRHFNCRTGRVFLSAEDAARQGAGEARRVAETGERPRRPFFMAMPPAEIQRQMWF